MALLEWIMILALILVIFAILADNAWPHQQPAPTPVPAPQYGETLEEMIAVVKAIEAEPVPEDHHELLRLNTKARTEGIPRWLYDDIQQLSSVSTRGTR